MHDIKFIRANPEIFDAGMQKRGLPVQSAKILELDKMSRALETKLQELQSERNQVAKAIGQAKSKGEDASALLVKSNEINKELFNLQNAAEAIGDKTNWAEASRKLNELLASLPNIPADDVPVGEEEVANKEIRKWETPRQLDFPAKQHFEIGEKLGLMDFESAAKISGARFVVLKGALAKMERALGNFMLDIHTKEFGYTEIAPPLLVTQDSAFGTGNYPKFEDGSFQTKNEKNKEGYPENEIKKSFWLIPTAEMSLTNLVREDILEEKVLPLRYTAFTPCFRSEAGAAGRDTRGMIRQHQFYKTELVSIVHPEKSAEEHERMTSCAEAILQKLELPYRVMLLCSGDMGFSAKKTYDLEVWLPGQNAYREISSCSNCGDFQARRMKARFKKPGDKENRFVHTLNGSALAVGRTIIAILENYQNADGSVNIPDALQKYMDGEKIIK